MPACSPNLGQPFQTTRASLGAPAPGNADLVNLPAPQQKIVAAVYKFRDQTGQYKPSVNGASWSTAVTQGTTTILLKSLEESGWFTPIERENLGNLLNERKIIRSTRAEAEAITKKPEPNLPGLLFAGIILEGGIISYDANVITGGAGLRYFGAGGSGQYREDKVTVYLRAISTSTGEILKTVYTSKTILSQAVDIGIFRYVKFKRLLEAETGFTYNEPSEMAVKEAIDKAVQSLIIEGVQEGYWKLKNKDDLQSPLFREYAKEKEQVENSDVNGRYVAVRRGALGLSGGVGLMLYKGDYSGQKVQTFMEGGLRLSSRNNLAVDIKAGRGNLATATYFNVSTNFAEANLYYNFFPKLRYTPYFQLGSGALLYNSDQQSYSIDSFDPYVKAGLGIEYLVTDRVGLDLNVSSSYLMNDNFDSVEQGRFNDYFWTAKVGLNFYLNLYK
ncbi:CsgG/HfaB family protein [uncultured Pontibacter sp.]|uniref:CsgG/HfaB family protein n=1 Tax=uncultured Pontibacter sp. TaxID=453356 RepID=UPI00260162A4|nr:CsgG/HfaB family protein [uncultured Pontibacter sp.]